MKQVIIICIVLFSCTTLFAKVIAPSLTGRAGGESYFSVKVTNPSSTLRKDVPVVIGLRRPTPIPLPSGRGEASAILSAQVTVSLPNGRGEGVGLLPSQLDDLDGDLIPDELAFVADIPAHSTCTFLDASYQLR